MNLFGLKIDFGQIEFKCSGFHFVITECKNYILRTSKTIKFLVKNIKRKEERLKHCCVLKKYNIFGKHNQRECINTKKKQTASGKRRHPFHILFFLFCFHQSCANTSQESLLTGHMSCRLSGFFFKHTEILRMERVKSG